MYTGDLGATGVGTRVPAAYPNASPYNLPQELIEAGYRGQDFGQLVNLPRELVEGGYGQTSDRMSAGVAVLVTGLIAASAAGIGVLIGWLAERRSGKAPAMARFGAWEHTGGGCFVASDDPYPCDDDYENPATGERVQIRTTPDRHFSLPTEVETMEEVFRMTGVQEPYPE